MNKKPAVEGVKEQKIKKDDKITLEGVVEHVYPEMRYKVDVDFKGLKHSVICYVSGKMRNRFIEIKRGDKVRIKVSLYDIDSGIIVFRLTDRKAPEAVVS
ncbi:MAG: translation initiation factor IF-1 [Candidatus Dojkabacteria bacterium]